MCFYLSEKVILNAKYCLNETCFTEFREERRQILEMVGPELQSTYDDRYIEVKKHEIYVN